MHSGFLYTMRMIPDLKLELGKKYKFSSEREIAIQGGIRREDILGATPISGDGRSAGHTVLNPYRE